jgi:hypothetical protein
MGRQRIVVTTIESSFVSDSLRIENV